MRRTERRSVFPALPTASGGGAANGAAAEEAPTVMEAYSAYVPCYNNSASISRAVVAVLRQTVPPTEVIVVDDGSTDGSAELLRHLPVRVIRHERNMGRGAARATAME